MDGESAGAALFVSERAVIVRTGTATAAVTEPGATPAETAAAWAMLVRRAAPDELPRDVTAPMTLVDWDESVVTRKSTTTEEPAWRRRTRREEEEPAAVTEIISTLVGDTPRAVAIAPRTASVKALPAAVAEARGRPSKVTLLDT